MDFDTLSDLFVQSVKNIQLEDRLLDLVKTLKNKGTKIALVTDNMDSLDILIKHKNLGEIFPVIVNSFNHGMLKSDFAGKLFDVAMEKVGADDYGKALLIDDSLNVKPVFEGKGGTVFTYKNYNEFEEWMGNNII